MVSVMGQVMQCEVPYQVAQPIRWSQALTPITMGLRVMTRLMCIWIYLFHLDVRIMVGSTAWLTGEQSCACFV